MFRQTNLTPFAVPFTAKSGIRFISLFHFSDYHVLQKIMSYFFVKSGICAWLTLFLLRLEDALHHTYKKKTIT